MCVLCTIQKVNWHLLATSVNNSWSQIQLTVIKNYYTALCTELFHMTSRSHIGDTKQWNGSHVGFTKPILWEFNSSMKTLPFVSIILHVCWPCEWKRSIVLQLLWSNIHEETYPYVQTVLLRRGWSINQACIDQPGHASGQHWPGMSSASSDTTPDKNNQIQRLILLTGSYT